MCSSSREEPFLEWATLVDRLRFSFFYRACKRSPIFTPFYVTWSYILPTETGLIFCLETKTNVRVHFYFLCDRHIWCLVETDRFVLVFSLGRIRIEEQTEKVTPLTISSSGTHMSSSFSFFRQPDLLRCALLLGHSLYIGAPSGWSCHSTPPAVSSPHHPNPSLRLHAPLELWLGRPYACNLAALRCPHAPHDL
jgi:hypothetical protein